MPAGLTEPVLSEIMSDRSSNEDAEVASSECNEPAEGLDTGDDICDDLDIPCNYMDNQQDDQQDAEDVEDEPVFHPNQRSEAILEMLSVEGNVQLKGDNVYAKSPKSKTCCTNGVALMPHLEYTFKCWH